MQKNGFMLFELVIALALFACITSLSFLNDAFLTQHQVRAELDKMHTAILYGHRCGLASGREEYISFNTQGQTYNVDGHVQCLAPGIIFGAPLQAKGPPSAPIHAITNPITFSKQRIACNADGIMQAGTIYVGDVKKRYCYAMSIPVGHVSYIRKYVYAQSRWTLL